MSHQSQSEYIAGYQHGLQGGSEPKPDKGRSFFGGFLAGRADREQEFNSSTTQGRAE